MTNEEIASWMVETGWFHPEGRSDLAKALNMARADEREKAKEQEQFHKDATRRFDAAKAAMQGFLSDFATRDWDEKTVVTNSVRYGDSLLAELDKPEAKS